MNSFWENKSVLVTGSTGLVGFWLTKALLDAGARVTALVRNADPQSEFYRTGTHQRTSIVTGSIENPEDLQRAINEYETDAVFHLAAQPLVEVARRYPAHTLRTNILGTINVLEACRIQPSIVKRLVVESSDKAYGQQPKLPYDEDMPLMGRYPYDVSKSCVDLICQMYYHTYELPVGIARCGNIYGGGDTHWDRIVPGTIRSFIQGKRPIIRSNGKFVRDYFYVKDAANAYMRLAEGLEDKSIFGQAFNFSPSRPLTVLELVKIIQTALGVEELEPEIKDTAKKEIQSQYLCSDKAKRLLGWSPKYSAEEGLAETIGWYRDYFRLEK